MKRVFLKINLIQIFIVIVFIASCDIDIFDKSFSSCRNDRDCSKKQRCIDGSCVLGCTGYFDIKTEEGLGYIRKCEVINKSLIFSGTQFTRISLPELKEVNGPLIVSANGKLTSLDLPKLERIEHGLELTENDSLENVAFPALKYVGFSKNSIAETRLSPPEPPELNIKIYENKLLETISFPKLLRVVDLKIGKFNYSLKSISMPQLESARSMEIVYNPVLEGFDFSNLSMIGELKIEQNPKLSQKSVDNLLNYLSEPGNTWRQSIFGNDWQGWIDEENNLEWSIWSPFKYSAVYARDYCENIEEGGHSDWRLPTIGELRTLVMNSTLINKGGVCKVDDDCLLATDVCYDKEVCSENSWGNRGLYSIFRDDLALWSVSKDELNDKYNWLINFSFGRIDIITYDLSTHARCVRDVE